MPVTADKPAPYSPGSTILEVIERHRTRGLPSPINAEVLGRAGIAQTLIPRVLQSLEALDLIDEGGNPSPTFEGIRRAPETEYRNQLAEWLKSTYADVFTFVDPLKDDDTRVRDAFRNYQPIGQQPRMVALFQALCGAAGLRPEKQSQLRASRPRAITEIVPAAPRIRTYSKRVVADHPKEVTRRPGSLPAPLAGLLERLPSEGDTWTKAERAKFIATFTAVLDFCFEVDDSKGKTETAA